MLLTQVSYHHLHDGSKWYSDDVDTFTVLFGGGAGGALRETASSNGTEHFARDVGSLAEEGRRGCYEGDIVHPASEDGPVRGH